jgi:hypothetical protein
MQMQREGSTKRQEIPGGVAIDTNDTTTYTYSPRVGSQPGKTFFASINTPL